MPQADYGRTVIKGKDQEMQKTSQQLLESAAAKEAEAAASFERCDTDGFLSQWALGIGAAKDRMEADLLEAGGVHEFPALFDLQGNWVRAKLIEGKYGTCWMLLDEAGEPTGKFVGAFPKQRKTLEAKGYMEGYVIRPARVVLSGGNYGNVFPVRIAADKPYQQPISIVSTDRFAWKAQKIAEREAQKIAEQEGK
jgi:hypothetical protein